MSDDLPEKKINPSKFKPATPARAMTVDDSKHTHQRFDSGASPSFDPSCRACVKADRERKPVPETELERTVFFYPRDGHSQTLCQAYLESRYPGMVLEHSAYLPIWQLVSADIQIVCVRPLADVGKTVLSKEVTTRDAWNKPQQTPRDLGEMLAQVCESAPLKTKDLCHLVGGNAGRIAISGRWNADALIAAIHENMAGYRVAVPEQKNSEESMSAWPV